MPKLFSQAPRNFTVFSKQQLDEMLPRIPEELFLIASDAKSIMVNSEYQKLVTEFQGLETEEEKRKFLQENIGQITEFLNLCGLMGHEGEKVSDKNPWFIPGAEAFALVSASLASKEKNKDAHPVEVIKNIEANQKQHGSASYTSVLLEQKKQDGSLIHDGFKKALDRDLAGIGAGAFSKTYVVEIYGTTGENHFVVVTIHRNQGEKDPVINIFDPSVSSTRNGIESAENAIASGRCSQFVIRDTLEKSFGKVGMTVNNDKFYNNSEPVQMAGTLYCGTFSIKMAHEIAAKNPTEFREFLEKHYTHQSPYGGKTDMEVDVEKLKVQEKHHYPIHRGDGLMPEALLMSHFVLGAEIEERLASVEEEHVGRKYGAETFSDRFKRYKQEDGQTATNDFIEQRVLRWPLVIFQMLSEMMQQNLEGKDLQPKLFPKLKLHENPPAQIISSSQDQMIAELNNILPRPNKVHQYEFDEESKECRLTIYIGNISGAKLEELIKEYNEGKDNPIKLTHSENIIAGPNRGAHPDFGSVRKTSITIAEQNFQGFTDFVQTQKNLVPDAPSTPYTKSGQQVGAVERM